MEQTRQTEDERIGIVREYCATLPEGDLLTACFLLSVNVPEKEILWRMKIGRKRLEAIKAQIADGLRKAGLRIDGEGR